MQTMYFKLLGSLGIGERSIVGDVIGHVAAVGLHAHAPARAEFGGIEIDGKGIVVLAADGPGEIGDARIVGRPAIRHLPFGKRILLIAGIDDGDNLVNTALGSSGSTRLRTRRIHIQTIARQLGRPELRKLRRPAVADAQAGNHGVGRMAVTVLVMI